MTLTLITSILATAIMLYAVWLIIAFKKHIPGCVVGKNWKSLTGLVFLFTIGYVAMPFIGKLSADTLSLVVSIIFLFGAIYVVVTITLIKRIILTLID